MARGVGLNSVRREIVSSVTIVFYDKVRGRNKAQDNIMAYRGTRYNIMW